MGYGRVNEFYGIETVNWVETAAVLDIEILSTHSSLFFALSSLLDFSSAPEQTVNHSSLNFKSLD